MHDPLGVAPPASVLGQLSARCALVFGAHLLECTAGGPFGFAAIRRVAADLVHEDPGAAATYLAVLVALDIERTAGEVQEREVRRLAARN